MKIAIIGIRGVPVTYSAFETFARVLGTELVKRNHSVTVYCRQGLVEKNKKTFEGITLKTLWHIPKSSFSTFSHSLLATLHACFFCNYDVILYLGVGNVLFSFLPRLVGIKTVVHIDGMDWKREKWGVVGKNYLKLSEYLTTILPNAVITDSVYMVSYYRSKYNTHIFYIPYGYFSQPDKRFSQQTLKKYALKKRTYFVWVGRFVPDNHIEDFLEAFVSLKNKKIFCVILGDDLYKTAYKKHIYTLLKKNKKIIFNGFIPHEEVLALEENSLAYIETKRSGGTHVSLVEAMGVGSLIVSHHNTANKNVLGEAALFYDKRKEKTSLKSILIDIVNKPRFFDRKREAIEKRAKKYYEWSSIISQYEELFADL